jgi:hypothetical protein
VWTRNFAGTNQPVRETKEQIVTKMIRLSAAAAVLTAATLVLAMTTAIAAQDSSGQEKPAPATGSPKPPAAAPEKPAPARPPQIPVRIQLVLSRYQGEKKVSSVPYLLWLTTAESTTRLRMGVKIPMYSGGAYSYQDVGTNIDSNVNIGPDGMFKVNLTVNDSSVYFPDPARQGTGIPPATADTPPPAIRSFTSTFTILLRDGQTGQYTSAVDQASGEVLKIDATLNVLK